MITRRAETEDENIIDSSYSWMLTFSDLLLLLLTLFVLRLSMSSLDGATLYRALSELVQTESEYQRPSAERSVNELTVSSPERSPEAQNLVTALSDALSSSNGQPQGDRESGGALVFGSSIELVPENEAVLLRFGSSSFPEGGDELSFGAGRALRALGKALAGESVTISLRAHSDSKLPSSAQFPTNWELTSAQAAVAARQIIDAGVDPQSISVMGYASSAPLNQADTPAALHQNRRLEIRVTPLGK